MKVLSIDAWYGVEGWTWNAWYTAGGISIEEFEKLKTRRATIKWFRDNGYIGEESKGKVAIKEEDYNLVLIDKNTKRPLYAIESGLKYL